MLIVSFDSATDQYQRSPICVDGGVSNESLIKLFHGCLTNKVPGKLRRFVLTEVSPMSY